MTATRASAIPAVAPFERNRDARQGKVAEAARDFLERPAGVRGQDRKIDLEHDLIRLEAIAQRGDEEFLGRDFAPAARAPAP